MFWLVATAESSWPHCARSATAHKLVLRLTEAVNGDRLLVTCSCQAFCGFFALLIHPEHWNATPHLAILFPNFFFCFFFPSFIVRRSTMANTKNANRRRAGCRWRVHADPGADQDLVMLETSQHPLVETPRPTGARGSHSKLQATTHILAQNRGQVTGSPRPSPSAWTEPQS